jgi:type IV pilus biogenesis protein CpaD/CtpE
MSGKRFTKLLIVSSVILAAGCSQGARESYYDSKARYTAAKARWSPVYVASRTSRLKKAGVAWTQITYVAEFRPKTARLTPGARAGLSNLGSRYGGRGVRVTVLMDYPADKDAKKLLERRRRAISVELAKHGLSARNIRAVPGAKHRNSAVVLVAVRRAIVSSCREWKSAVSGALPPAEEWRYGCATRSALRAHIDNPSDLVGGRPLGDFDGVSAAKTITDYREGKLDKLPDSGGTSGGSSQ